ncbi:GNAT family N-acetyltransferase [Turicibacter sanguinis]|uniref:GNAT family N-acetyltransferase n=1 Tax=Turicibacter sanguinis TaxID=154288 RepID=UPI00232D80F3|nr:GNAT family N-acetyltransferase [Turicibacter sanguinis]MDB8562234.1 GNAT family N-acetyltransferase [Turicibacter sanguinis]
MLNEKMFKKLSSTVNVELKSKQQQKLYEDKPQLITCNRIKATNSEELKVIILHEKFFMYLLKQGYCCIGGGTYLGKHSALRYTTNYFSYKDEGFECPYLKLENLYIQKAFQSKGMGTKLLKDLLELANEIDSAVGLWASNDKVKNWYIKLGFKELTRNNDGETFMLYRANLKCE